MWTEGLLIAIVTVLGGLLAEMIRARKRQDKVVGEITNNGGSSLKDAIGRIETALTELRGEVDAIRDVQSRSGERLAALEAVAEPPGRRLWR